MRAVFRQLAMKIAMIAIVVARCAHASCNNRRYIRWSRAESSRKAHHNPSKKQSDEVECYGRLCNIHR
jgi:hypothetical protein